MWLINPLVLCTISWLLRNGDTSFAKYFVNLCDAVPQLETIGLVLACALLL